MLPVGSLFIAHSQTHFELRYFCFLLPVWLLLAASGMVDGTSALTSLSGAASPRLRQALLCLLIGLTLFLDAGELRAYYRFPKARTREAFAYIGDHSIPGDAVVFYPAWNILWYGYYSLPPGRRLYHPSLLYDKSSAFSPEALVPAHERLWLAATWIKDPTRLKEFEELKASVERYYMMDQETTFISRDPNDDYKVWLFRRKPTIRPALARARQHSWEYPAMPQDSWPIRMALNLQEATQSMTASHKFFFRMLDNVALLRGPAFGGSALAEASAFCRGGCLALAWSGTGRISDHRASSGFEPGDLFDMPAGDSLSSVTRSSGEVLLVLQTPHTPHASAPPPASYHL